MAFRFAWRRAIPFRLAASSSVIHEMCQELRGESKTPHRTLTLRRLISLAKRSGKRSRPTHGSRCHRPLAHTAPPPAFRFQPQASKTSDTAPARPPECVAPLPRKRTSHQTAALWQCHTRRCVVCYIVPITSRFPNHLECGKNILFGFRACLQRGDEPLDLFRSNVSHLLAPEKWDEMLSEMTPKRDLRRKFVLREHYRLPTGYNSANVAVGRAR